MTRFLDLCDKASCSPDFDVVYGLGHDQAVDWLTTRLRKHGRRFHRAAVAAAYDEWCNRPRGKEHTVWTGRL